MSLATDVASVSPAMEQRKETTKAGAKNLVAVDATAARSDQVASELNREQPREGAVKAPLNQNAILAVGALPLKNTLVDLKDDASAQAPIRPAQTSASTQLRGNEWFAGLDPDRFTLQLLSLTKEASTRAFIQNRHLQEQAAYFTVRNDDQKIWYAITYGLYDSYELAASAGKSLPDSIKDLEPKVRNTGRIQQLMRR
ncbi:MAG: SPOR domain-containing protein [Pseudomonadales bacterium]